MKSKLKRSLLAVLNACEGLPFPETALLTAGRLHARPLHPTDTDLLQALRELETQGFVAGITDELTHERTWMLTTKGTHRAREGSQ